MTFLVISPQYFNTREASQNASFQFLLLSERPCGAGDLPSHLMKITSSKKDYIFHMKITTISHAFSLLGYGGPAEEGFWEQDRETSPVRDGRFRRVVCLSSLSLLRRSVVLGRSSGLCPKGPIAAASCTHRVNRVSWNGTGTCGKWPPPRLKLI